MLGWAAGTRRTAAGTNIFSTGIFEHTHARGAQRIMLSMLSFSLYSFHIHYYKHISRRRTLSLCSLHPPPPLLCCSGMLCVGDCRGSDVNPIDNPGVRTAGHYASKYYEQSS